ATLIAVYGVFMTPLGWGWALFVWAYALVWFLVNDRVKLLVYWIFDRHPSALKNTPEVGPESPPKKERHDGPRPTQQIPSESHP
ncbi:MAG: hypothetical protein ABIP39_14385, partial [Polyangiaceae bacterium]